MASALLRRRVWLGLRRYPARSALRRFPEQGVPLYPRRGLRSLHPDWGTAAAVFLTWRVRMLPNLSRTRGPGLGLDAQV